MRDIILIIGASSDIGLELIAKLDGESLIIGHYRSSNERLLELKKKIKNDLVTVQADLSDLTQLTDMLNIIETKWGAPNKIVHLAASKFEFVRFKNASWNQLQSEIDISLRSITLILNRFIPIWIQKRQGKIVVMLSSVTLNIPPKALSQYTVVKYALLGLVKSLASEFAEKNIQINAVSPSMVETKFLEQINEKHVELNAYNHPLKRNASAGDITPTIQFLLSPASDYMNGLNIPIAGGSVF